MNLLESFFLIEIVIKICSLPLILFCYSGILPLVIILICKPESFNSNISHHLCLIHNLVLINCIHRTKSESKMNLINLEYRHFKPFFYLGC